MDLADLTPKKEPHFVHLHHPVTEEPLLTDDGEPIGVYVVGTDSDEYAERERWLIDRRIKAAEAKAMGKKPQDFDFRNEGLETLVSCVKGWKNIILDGEEFAFSAENARKLLLRLRWVRDVLDREMANRANFIKG